MYKYSETNALLPICSKLNKPMYIHYINSFDYIKVSQFLKSTKNYLTIMCRWVIIYHLNKSLLYFLRIPTGLPVTAGKVHCHGSTTFNQSKVIADDL